MTLTSRKKRPLNRRIPSLRDTRLIIIATEGEKTEKQYFDGMFHNTKVQVLILPTIDSKSAPQYVFKRLSDFKKEYELDKNDELWLMVDIDRWEMKEISIIADDSLKKGFSLAVSNPCFELWLYLHHAELDKLEKYECDYFASQLKTLLGSYNKSNLNIDKFKDKIEIAVDRAKKLHKNLAEKWPSSTGTHVYKVVEKILKLTDTYTC